MKQLGKKAIAARNQYAKAWRAKNREKVKEYNARYWAKKAAQAEEEAKNKNE